MENSTIIGIALVLGSNAIAAISQILLKKASGKNYNKWWMAYLNIPVVTAYALFVLTTLLSVFAMRFIPLSLCAALAASGQIFVPILSVVFLKEKIGSKKLQGMLLIIIGIIVFSI